MKKLFVFIGMTITEIKAIWQFCWENRRVHADMYRHCYEREGYSGLMPCERWDYLSFMLDLWSLIRYEVFDELSVWERWVSAQMIDE